MARVPSPHNALHRRLWVPGRRTGDFSPLRTPKPGKTRNGCRSRRSPTRRRRRCAPSGIFRTPLPRSGGGLLSLWSSVSRGALVAAWDGSQENGATFDAVRLEHFHPEWNRRGPLSLRGAERRSNPPPGEPPLVTRGIALMSRINPPVRIFPSAARAGAEATVELLIV
jgi:hypothetical protein